MTNKEKYIAFCKQEKDIPIFSQPWWLDTVCGANNWDVCLVEKGGEIMASLPFYIVRKTIFNIITMPKLTQKMGPYIKYPKGQQYYKKLSWEKNVMQNLISQLPSYDYFIQNFDHTITNFLPFYWKQYTQTTRYTYVIDPINHEDIYENVESGRRKNIKKALKSGVTVHESQDIDTFYELNKKTFARQNMKIPYTHQYVKDLYHAATMHNACKIYFAKNKYGNIIAGNFLVYDANTVYYIMGGIDPQQKDLGGMDLVQYEGIKFAMKTNSSFDFEGSMIESIEKYFRSFGAIQKPYFSIKKTNSKLLKCRDFILDLKQ